MLKSNQTLHKIKYFTKCIASKIIVDGESAKLFTRNNDFVGTIENVLSGFSSGKIMAQCWDNIIIEWENKYVYWE